MNKFLESIHRPVAGYTLLRVSLALLLLLHGASKLQHGIGFIEGMLAAKGLPTVLAYGVYVGEVVAPLLLLLGVWVVPAALVIAVNMVVAVLLVHTGQLLTMTQQGGWALELQGFYFVSAVALALLAPRSLIGAKAR